VQIEALHRAFDHPLCGQDLGLTDRGRRFDIDDDRVVAVDQVVGRVGEEGRSPPRAGSAGAMNFGVTSLAAPNG
jgi:hypothetical protein